MVVVNDGTVAVTVSKARVVDKAATIGVVIVRTFVAVSGISAGVVVDVSEILTAGTVVGEGSLGPTVVASGCSAGLSLILVPLQHPHHKPQHLRR